MINYKDSGVDIDSGNRAVELIKKHVSDTFINGVVGGIGLFSGGFSLDEFKDMKSPTLLASTDGVGTKLLIAQAMDRHNTVGIDLVAMCVNDLICQGARPLFFLDYIGADRIVPEKIEQIVEGIAKGCKETDCAIIGGETAELPGMYSKDEYDLAGFSVGIVDRDKIITGEEITEGNTVIGLKSSGLHSNGYSLARKIFYEELKCSNDTEINGYKVGEMLLEPTKLYVRTVLKLIDEFNVLGIANITGGGFIENIPRIIPEGYGVEINLGTWEKPEVIKIIEESGLVSREELYRTFNMGIGMVVIVKDEDAEKVTEFINENTTDKAYIIGKITKGKGVELKWE